MKTINKFHWNNYLESKSGKNSICLFRQLKEEPFDKHHLMDFISEFNDQCFLNFTLGQKYEFICKFDHLVDCYKDFNIDNNDVSKFIDTIMGHLILTEFGIYDIQNLGHNSLEYWLSYIPSLSFVLYRRYPEYFFPYMYVTQFFKLQNIFNEYDIELPALPKKANYNARFMYYFELCKAVTEFRVANGFTPEELCAFLYDYEPKRIASLGNKEMPIAEQAWFVGGISDEEELKSDYMYWQANADAKRGDLLIFYEKAPVKSINGIWIAQEDGFIDPFFYFYAMTYMGHKMEVPLISIEELKTDKYFSSTPIIRKNLQGFSGWSVSGRDYEELMRMWKAKGADITTFPKLLAPKAPADKTFEHESDVEDKLIIPMLSQMGWTMENGDYEQQHVVQVGRGKSKKSGRTDFSLFLYGEDNENARVIIEAKKFMKNKKEVDKTFDQGKSYAKQQSSSLLITTDMEKFIVYEHHKGEFHKERISRQYSWSDILSDHDTFIEVKHLLESYNKSK